MLKQSNFTLLVSLSLKLLRLKYFMLPLADELGDFAAELKLSFFQLGISPQIIASIIMQVCCFYFPFA